MARWRRDLRWIARPSPSTLPRAHRRARSHPDVVARQQGQWRTLLPAAVATLTRAGLPPPPADLTAWRAELLDGVAGCGLGVGLDASAPPGVDFAGQASAGLGWRMATPSGTPTAATVQRLTPLVRRPRHDPHIPSRTGGVSLEGLEQPAALPSGDASAMDAEEQ